ncbi:MAG: hypothetical protein ACW7DM_17570, partial [Paraglaciecola chathamensis]
RRVRAGYQGMRHLSFIRHLGSFHFDSGLCVWYTSCTSLHTAHYAAICVYFVHITHVEDVRITDDLLKIHGDDWRIYTRHVHYDVLEHVRLIPSVFQ